VPKTKVQTWGNSLGLRIPKALAEQIGVTAGSEVEIRLREGGIFIVPRRRYSLEELLAAMPADAHAEIDWGEAQGREEW